MDEKKTDVPISAGRPSISVSKRQRMRLEIANVARKLFQAEGYSKISMRRIAGEIGCSPMTLYKYYDAKVDILRTLWADVFNELFDQLKVGSNTHDNLLFYLSSGYVRYWLDHTEYYRLVFISDGVTQSDVNIFLDNPEIGQHFTIFAEALLATCSSDIPLEELKTRVDALLCFLNGIAHNHITISGYSWSDSDKMVALAVNAVID